MISTWVSVDGFLNLNSSNSILFNSKTFSAESGFGPYLSSIRDHLELVNRFENRRMIYAAKDIPPMHYYQFPNLTRFKAFFWQKTILNIPELAGKRFEDLTPNSEMYGVCLSIWNQFIKIPSTEIWSDETINITLRQLEYYFDTEIIGREQSLVVVNELHNMVTHVREEASTGRKMHFGSPNSGSASSFHLYFNEIAIGDNTAFFEMDNQKTVFLTYNMLNILSTTDEPFCMGIEAYFNNIIQKSTLISGAGEKERNKFFNRMESKVVALKNKIMAQATV